MSALQILVDTCEKELNVLDMRINVKKSACIRFGSRFNGICEALATTGGGSINFVSSCRYLGVYFFSGRIFRCIFDDAKSRFFRAFNAIMCKVGRIASEEVVLALFKAKCLPILLYAMEACPVLSRQLHSLEFTVMRVLMKLFATGSVDMVNTCLIYFNILPIKMQLLLRTARFLQKFCVYDIATEQLNVILGQYRVRTACQLANTMYMCQQQLL